MDGYPLGLGLVVEDKPTEFSCVYGHTKSTSKHGTAFDLLIFTKYQINDLNNLLFVYIHTDSGYAIAIVIATVVYMVFYFIAIIWIFFADYIW